MSRSSRLVSAGLNLSVVLNRRVSQENRSLLCFPPHTLSSLPKNISAPNRISSAHISGMKLPWGQCGVLQTPLTATGKLSGPHHCKAGGQVRETLFSLCMYPQVDSRSAGTRSNFPPEWGFRKLILDQRSHLSLIRVGISFHWTNHLKKLLFWVFLERTFVRMKCLIDLTCQSRMLTNHGHCRRWAWLLKDVVALDRRRSRSLPYFQKEIREIAKLGKKLKDI